MRFSGWPLKVAAGLRPPEHDALLLGSQHRIGVGVLQHQQALVNIGDILEWGWQLDVKARLGDHVTNLSKRIHHAELPLIDHKYAELAYATSLAAADAPPEEAANRFINYIEKLLLKMELPSKLSEIGIGSQDIPEIVEAAFHSSSLEANPRRTRAEDLAHILENSL